MLHPRPWNDQFSLNEPSVACCIPKILHQYRETDILRALPIIYGGTFFNNDWQFFSSKRLWQTHSIRPIPFIKNCKNQQQTMVPCVKKMLEDLKVNRMSVIYTYRQFENQLEKIRFQNYAKKHSYHLIYVCKPNFYPVFIITRDKIFSCTMYLIIFLFVFHYYIYFNTNSGHCQK